MLPRGAWIDLITVTRVRHLFLTALHPQAVTVPPALNIPAGEKSAGCHWKPGFNLGLG